jgi:predicted RNA-binding protein with PUA domain
MRTCEFLSGASKIIEAKQQEIQAKVDKVEHVKKESEFLEHIVISKEEHIEMLYMFIGQIGVNFRSKNYDEIDRMLKKLNL